MLGHREVFFRKESTLVGYPNQMVTLWGGSVYTFNPSTQEVKGGSLRPVWSTK